MASNELIGKIRKTFRADLHITLQDFSDEEIKRILINEKPRDWWELENILLHRTTDKEVESHILGFTSYEERQKEIEKLEELKRKVEEQIHEYQQSSDRWKTDR